MNINTLITIIFAIVVIGCIIYYLKNIKPKLTVSTNDQENLDSQSSIPLTIPDQYSVNIARGISYILPSNITDSIAKQVIKINDINERNKKIIEMGKSTNNTTDASLNDQQLYQELLKNKNEGQQIQNVSLFGTNLTYDNVFDTKNLQNSHKNLPWDDDVQVGPPICNTTITSNIKEIVIN